MMGKVRKASKQKFRTPEGFRYASQRPEAFGKGIEYKPEGGYDPVKRRDTIAPRNVGTAKRQHLRYHRVKAMDQYLKKVPSSR